MRNRFAELRHRVDERTFYDLADALGVLAAHGNALHCPAHDDANPSAGIVEAKREPGVWLWTCSGCGETGDAVKFVKVRRGLASQTKAAKWLERWLAGEQPPGASAAFSATSATSRSSPTGKATLDVRKVRQAVRRKEEATALAARFFTDKFANAGDRPDAEWVVQTFFLGCGETKEARFALSTLYFPYLTYAGGREGARGKPTLAGATHRSPRGRGKWTKPFSEEGSRCDLFYGEWRDVDARPFIVVCEGESDTIAVAWWLREWPNTVALGVHGASTTLTERMAARLAGRRVILLPDQDDDGDGRQWAAQWSAGVRQASAASVVVATLPPGQDACTAGRTAVRDAVLAAVHPRNRRERRAHLQ